MEKKAEGGLNGNDLVDLEKVTKNMTDEQRMKLAAELDLKMESYMKELESKGASKYMDGWNPDIWQQEMEQHPFFAGQMDPDAELSPLLQGIQQLKYSEEENTPEELAKNYKEDGNFNFKCKKYRLAIASYTQGLKYKVSRKSNFCRIE